MAIEQKVEAVKKITEAMSKQQQQAAPEQIERMPPNSEHFQNLLDQTRPIQPTFQKIEGMPLSAEGTQPIEKNPIFAEDNVSVQKNGSATDQERKHKRHSQTEEVDEVTATNSKKIGPSSLMDEVQKLNTQASKMVHLTPEDLQKQVQGIVTQIDQVKTQISQATDIKPSYQTVLRNRLTHIDDNLKIALSKAGVEYTPPAKVTGTGAGTLNPIERFLGYLTNSQHQLNTLNQSIEQLNLTKVELTPANMLAIQIKVGYVQQQIELFTSLLNKALESTKTIMNVQV